MTDEQEEASIFKSSFDPKLEFQLQQISKWSRLIAVIGFSIGAFVVVAVLVNGATIFRSLEAMMPVKIAGMYGALVALFFIIFFIAAAVLYFLYKASHFLKEGVQQKDSVQIGEGFVFLNRFFIAMALFSGLSLIANLTMLFQ